MDSGKGSFTSRNSEVTHGTSLSPLFHFPPQPVWPISFSSTTATPEIASAMCWITQRKWCIAVSGVWQYRKPHWSKLLFTAQNDYTRILSQWSYVCFPVLNRPSPFSESCTKTLRDQSNENLTDASPEKGAQAEASLDNSPWVLNAITILSFPNFSCICIWVNKLANLTHYILMEAEAFVEIQQVESSDYPPGPSKGEQYV